MYQVTKQITFCYGHRLLNYDGPCRHLHGHNALAEVVVQSDALDPRGMVVDFSDIKGVIKKWIDENLDHRMLLCRRDPILAQLKDAGEPLHEMSDNPTAENIAKLIFTQARGQGLPVVEVRLWETPTSCASFRAP